HDALPILNRVLVSQRQHEHRLNDFVNKAPFKLKVNLYLIRNKKELGLDDVTIKRLRRRYYNQMIVLLRHKDLKLTWFYIKSLGLYDFKINTRLKIYKNFIIGFFYKYCGFGYKYLNMEILRKNGKEL